MHRIARKPATESPANGLSEAVQLPGTNRPHATKTSRKLQTERGSTTPAVSLVGRRFGVWTALGSNRTGKRILVKCCAERRAYRLPDWRPGR